MKLFSFEKDWKYFSKASCGHIDCYHEEKADISCVNFVTIVFYKGNLRKHLASVHGKIKSFKSGDHVDMNQMYQNEKFVILVQLAGDSKFFPWHSLQCKLFVYVQASKCERSMLEDSTFFISFVY